MPMIPGNKGSIGTNQRTSSAQINKYMMMIAMMMQIFWELSYYIIIILRTTGMIELASGIPQSCSYR